MLEVFRKHSQSIVVKILFGLLIVSFAAWGVGDMIRVGAQADWVAEVGPARIGPNELDNEVRQEFERLRRALGPAFDQEKIQPGGIAPVVLQRLVDRKLLTLAADELGVAVPDDVVSANIRQDKTFINQLGQFDRILYEQTLASNGLSEDRYVGFLRGDLMRAQFLESVVADTGAQAPRVLAEAMFRHRFQQRTAEVVRIADAAMAEPAAPDEGTLALHHQNNGHKYTAPEYRALTVLRLEAADLMTGIEVTEAQAREAYDQRAGEFMEPERRELLQMVLTKEADARKAADLLAQGGDFARVAKDVANQTPEALTLGTVAKDELLPEVAEAAFAVAAGGVSAPVQSALGWHIVKAVKIEPGRQTGFAEARERLIKDVRKEKAVEALFDLANKVEDRLGGGGTIEEAGKEFGLKVLKIAAMDARGMDADGKPVPDLPPGKAFLDTAFATGLNQDSGIAETRQDGFFVLRVDGVTPPALRPLEKVRDQAVADWKESERHRLAGEAADKLVAAVQGGQDFAAAAKAAGLTVGIAGPFTRDGVGVPKEMPADLAARLFEVKVGEVAQGRAKDAVMVARLKEIVEADPVANVAGLTAEKKRLAGEMRGDLAQELAEVLQKRFPVKINNAAIKALYEPRS
jgi:peptidyl-prolyl cis-trans isomerase D